MLATWRILIRIACASLFIIPWIFRVELPAMWIFCSHGRPSEWKKTRGKSTAWKLCISLANHSDHFFLQNSRRTWPTRGKQSGGHSARTAAQNYRTQGLISRAGAGPCFCLFWNSSLGSGMYSRFHVPAKTYTLISSHVILSGFQGDQIIDNEGESRSVPSISIYKRIVRKWRHSQILHLLMVNLLNLCHSVSGNAVYIWYIYIQHICMLACMRSIHPSTHPIHT